MKNLLFILLVICLIGCGYDDSFDYHSERVEKHGMQPGTDSLELGGTIFYVDSVQGYCLVALISLQTEFKEDCQYPSWCPYNRINGKEEFEFINGLSDTICGGKLNTQIIVAKYGCYNNQEYSHNSGFYGAWCAASFVDTNTNLHDYWAANLRETMLYANSVGSSMWFASTSQYDKNNYYTYNCKDNRIIIEPKSQKRLPLVIRRHNFK